MKLVLLCIIILYSNSSLQDCIIDNRIMEDAWEQQLQTYLLSTTRIEPKSAHNSTGVEVQLSYIMKYFEFDSDEQLFRIFSWVHVKWQNEKLSWDPADYGGITETVIESSNIWIPRLRLLNDVDYDAFGHMFRVPCAVKSDGFVVCITKFDDVVVCSTVLTNWPYDTQECSLEIGNRCLEDPHKIRLRFDERAITMIGAEYGAEWDIMDYKQEENEDANVQLKMTFVLERHAEILSALLVYPSIILTILSTIPLIIDVRTKIRLWLICFNLINHFTFISHLHYEIPKYSFDVPRLLFFYRGSMIVTVLIVLLTIGLNAMCKLERAAPVWLSSVNDFVLNSPMKLVIQSRWKCETGVNKDTELWTNFANLSNSFVLFISCITYICLYLVFMPRPPPIKY